MTGDASFDMILTSKLRAWVRGSKEWIKESIRQKRKEDNRVMYTMDRYIRGNQ
jgi:hypothetical protein